MDIDIDQIAQRRREMPRPMEFPVTADLVQPVNHDVPMRDELQEQIYLIRWVMGV